MHRELDPTDLHENIAAITGEVFGSERYRDFADHHGPRVGGITGIWDICVRAGKAFTAAEPPDWEDHESETHIDYLTATQRMGEALTDPNNAHIVTAGGFDALSRWAIYNREPE